jgi:hypothetical protein
MLNHIINTAIQIFIENQLISMEPQEAALEPQVWPIPRKCEGITNGGIKLFSEKPMD